MKYVIFFIDSKILALDITGCPVYNLKILNNYYFQ